MGRVSKSVTADQGATLNNEQRINLLLQQSSDNDTVMYVLCRLKPNLAAIEDDKQRASLAAKFHIETPAFDQMFRQRLLEQIRKCKSKMNRDLHELQIHESLQEDDGQARELSDIPVIEIPRFNLGIESLNKLLGQDPTTGDYGMPYGCCAILGASRGVGKTRLMVQVAAAVGNPLSTEDEFGNNGVLYIQNEEKLEVFRSRYAQSWSDEHRILLSNSDDLLQHAALIDKHRPRLIVIDSIQDTRQARLSAGTVNMLKTYKAIATSSKCSFILISHLTTKGTLKGGTYPGHKVDIELFARKKAKSSPIFSVLCLRRTVTGRAGLLRISSILRGASDRRATFTLSRSR